MVARVKGRHVKILPPSATIIEDELSALSLYERIEQCVCYKSEDKITADNAIPFAKKW